MIHRNKLVKRSSHVCIQEVYLYICMHIYMHEYVHMYVHTGIQTYGQTGTDRQTDRRTDGPTDGDRDRDRDRHRDTETQRHRHTETPRDRGRAGPPHSVSGQPAKGKPLSKAPGTQSVVDTACDDPEDEIDTVPCDAWTSRTQLTPPPTTPCSFLRRLSWHDEQY